PDGAVVRIERGWADEDIPCAVWSKLADIFVSAGCEEIARAIKGQAKTLAGHRAESALCAVGSKLVDSAGKAWVGHILNHNEKISGAIELHILSKKVCAGSVNVCKRGLHPIRKDFQYCR